MPDTVYTARISQLPTHRQATGYRAAVIPTDGSQFVFTWLSPGVEHPAHEHPEDQLLIVFEGELEVDVAGEPHRISPGELLYIPSNVPHGGRVVSESPVYELTVYSPAMEQVDPPLT